MIDRYVILKRKPPIIMKLFICIIFFLTVLVICSINTFHFLLFRQVHSQILYKNNLFLLEVLIPAKEVNVITNQTKMRIGAEEYNYQVYEIDPNVVYEENTNYRKLYLLVDDLDESYQVNGYQIDIKIER